MDIEFFIDKLIPKQKLNRFHKIRARKVLYLKVDHEFFLEYHPWEEFGDLDVNSFREEIKKKKCLPNFLMQLLELEKNRKNIQNLSFRNHEFGKVDKSYHGQYLKIKYDNNYSFIENILSNGVKVRIDFNNNFHFDEFKGWFYQLENSKKELIDYLEDPGLKKLDLIELKKLGIQLASDRSPLIPDIYQVKIYKPSIEDLIRLDIPIIFSSYMGGDLGRYHTYLSLMLNGDLNLIHGIDTPGIYEGQLDLFLSDGLTRKIDNFQVNAMYKELENKEWQPL